MKIEDSNVQPEALQNVKYNKKKTKMTSLAPRGRGPNGTVCGPTIPCAHACTHDGGVSRSLALW